jgi:hypothetical protein
VHAQATDWQYGVYLLSIANDPARAQRYLERAQSESHGSEGTDALLFDRDLAEARVFAGDLTGATAAAPVGLMDLARAPLTAQFQAADADLYRRDLTAISAAASNQVEQLNDLASATAGEPDADPWYMLGWVRERAGDVAGARAAYAEYLNLAPAWSFLRSSAVMQAHARAVIGP